MIWIFGDSFSTNSECNRGWPSYFMNYKNISYNGISQYRIWSNYKKYENEIKDIDKVIITCTHWSRFYINDYIQTKTRKLSSHTNSDIIISEIDYKKDEIIKDVFKLWDEKYLKDMYYLMLNNMKKSNTLLISPFLDIEMIDYNYYSIWQNNKGDINHMNEQGNKLLYWKICELL